ncbi:Inner membrane protein YgaZ [uncultured Eubacterium sp.]|nr:Inner membrane protein YgaZ [uncultured Eubacterium sp.]
MKELNFAFKRTIPILLGYITLGIAFGILLQQAGFGWPWALLISTVVYAGSMQFVMVTFLGGGISLLSVILMTLSVNSRHMFYGISFIERFKTMGKARPYMIFSLTDETYSLFCGTKFPSSFNENKAMILMSAMNQCYWIIGSVLGNLIGNVIPFDTTGIDFAMTALFVVIFTEQWLAADSHIPTFIGLFSGIICLVIFGPDSFVLPSLILAVALLAGWTVKTEKSESEETETREKEAEEECQK